MLNQDYTAKMLNLEDVIITEVNCMEDQLHVSIELLRRKHVCPHCAAVTDRMHDYRMQIIKDVPLGRDTYQTLFQKIQIPAEQKQRETDSGRTPSSGSILLK